MNGWDLLMMGLMLSLVAVLTVAYAKGARHD